MWQTIIQRFIVKMVYGMRSEMYRMAKIITLGATAVMALFLAACGSDSDSGTTAKDTEEVSVQAETFDDLPNCSKSREGDLAEVLDERKAYRCQKGAWEFDHDVYDSVATEDDLPACTAKKEGLSLFVASEYAAYTCDGKRWSKAKKAVDMQEYETEEDLPNCSKSREGKRAYVDEVDGYFVCSDGVWVEDEGSGSSSSASKVPEPEEGTLTDSRDGRTYKTVVIGTQTWMAENLNYSTLKSTCPLENSSYCDKYGRIYQYASVDGTLCPSGWHIPTLSEWQTMLDYVDVNNGYEGVGKSLKSSKGWYEAGTTVEKRIAVAAGKDPFGFSALPAGSCWEYSGTWSCYSDDEARFWISNGQAYKISFDSDQIELDPDVGRTQYDYARISVRCIKDGSAVVANSSSSSENESGVGPVSQYGQLQTGTNSKGEGRIYGSCKNWSASGKEVQVRGLSLYWSINLGQTKSFWNKTVIDYMVKNLKIELIRAPMGVDENFGDGNYFSNTMTYQQYLDQVVQAAIDNDIYVIIDYHSHKAHDNETNAKLFFETMAQKWGGYDNVIFEIFNEPACLKNGSGNCETSSYGGGFLPWSSIKTYANQIIPVIRQYSDNLIIVGTPKWDQQPNAAIGEEVTDSENNTAYAFHYYAGTHTVEEEGANAEEAMQAGLPVFVSEWGTVNADGGGTVADANGSWQTWMDKYKLSSANWSVASLSEGASFFTTSGAWNYSQSGTWVKNNVLANNPSSYTKCAR